MVAPRTNSSPEVSPVRRRAVALLVDDLEVDAEHAPALPGGERGAFQRRLGALLRAEQRERADRAHLGHAPAVRHLDVVVAREGVDHGLRHGRAAAQDLRELLGLAPALLELLEQARATPSARPSRPPTPSLSIRS